MQATGGSKLGTGNLGQGTGGSKLDRELGVGNWDRELGQRTGGSKLETGNLGQGTGDRLGNWNWGQGTGGRELGTTLRRRERVLLLAQVEPWAGGGRVLDARVGL